MYYMSSLLQILLSYTGIDQKLNCSFQNRYSQWYHDIMSL